MEPGPLPWASGAEKWATTTLSSTYSIGGSNPCCLIENQTCYHYTNRAYNPACLAVAEQERTFQRPGDRFSGRLWADRAAAWGDKQRGRRVVARLARAAKVHAVHLDRSFEGPITTLQLPTARYPSAKARLLVGLLSTTSGTAHALAVRQSPRPGSKTFPRRPTATGGAGLGALLRTRIGALHRKVSTWWP